MRYAQPLSDQVLVFISSMGPGVLIGFIYDVIFSFLRTFGNRRVLTIIADLLFALTATMISFFYMVVYNSGTVRLNIVIAQLMGAVAFHYSMGKYVEKTVSFIARILTKLINIILRPFELVFKRTAVYIKKAEEKMSAKINIKEKIQLYKKKIKNIPKIHLKK